MVRLACEHETGDDVRVKLTLGVPGVSPDLFVRWLGVRFAAWLDGGDDSSVEFRSMSADFHERPRMGVASSRIGRALDERPDWFAALRAACAEARERRWSLLAVTGTTTGPFMADAARRSGLSCLQVEVADDRQSFDAWLREVVALSTSGSSLLTTPATSVAARLRLSPTIQTLEQWRRALASLEIAGLEWRRCDGAPPLEFSPPSPASGAQLRSERSDLLQAAADADFDVSEGRIDESLASIPASDRALCVLADELRLLEVRRRGNWAKLVEARQAESSFPAESMSKIDDCANPAAEGAVRCSASANTNLAIRASAPIVELSALDGIELLVHCTRRQSGPWPGQTSSDFFDELWDDAPAKDRSASAALRNILRTGRIVASGAAIRGATPMVCFTSTSPRELASLRKFRGHRHRWDFEPYGLAVLREWLRDRGARQVIYGDESTWAGLSDTDRPFFQPTNGRAAIDWTSENEWRLAGDLALDDIPGDAAYVLVATHDDAERLAPLSRWPLVAISLRRDERD
ncbi:MAG TPA: hypothetical protein PLV92_16745 [Pirellulaceae bacterium]|nr:hypothetical protein [Pirellulaceae bacterium]